MKQFKLFFLLFVLMNILSNNVSAHDAEVDGIYYNFSGEEATVTYKGESYGSYEGEYSGSIVIPETVEYNAHTYTVTSIGSCAFYECWGLTSIEIPNSVTSIGGAAFENCFGLTTIEIPSSVTSIGNSAFSYSGLTSIEIPNSVTSIGRNAFGGCSGLTTIEIPSSVTSIDRDAFDGTPWLDNKPDGVVYAGKLAYKYKGTMPSNTSIVLEEGTKGINIYAFSGCWGLTSIEIPNSVTSIGDYAFYGCYCLTSIEIPNSVTSIGDYTFSGCWGLTSIEIPNSVTSIGNYAFNDCDALTSIEIPSSVTSIGRDAFYGTPWYNNKPDGLVYAGKVAYKYKGTMPANTSFVLEDGTKGITSYAFDGCSGLTTIEIPSSVASIGKYAFYNCSSLTSIEIPNGVTSIGERTFYNCSGLTSIEIPNSVTNIGWRAFSGCAGLTSVEIPSSVTYINVAAFGDCSSLTSIKVESGNTNYDSRNKCNAIIETSSNMLICGCKNTVIPKSVTSIDQSAFYGCSDLTSIKIPKSVTAIGQSAFYNCSSLTSVKVEWETPISIISIGSNVFTNRANATLYVPTGSKGHYKSANYWKEFKEIVEYDINVEITMGSSGIATYCNSNDLDFTDVSGLKAYTAGGFSPSAGEVTMMRVYKVPAGEGLVLKGEPGSYEVPYADVDDIYANLLVGVPTATIVSPTDGEYTNLILTKKEGVIAFRELEETGTIASGKAYLHIPTTAYAACSRIYLVFEDEEEEAMGINSLNDKSEMMNDKAVYDLQGRRVMKPTRGLYIKDGKKFIKK